MDRAERSSDTSVETAGGDVIVTLIQNRPAPDPRSFIGDGKVAEMKALIAQNDCDLAVFDNELSPSQMRVLSEDLGIKVLDRSGLILDIFAQRARTREGKLQVELAQHRAAALPSAPAVRVKPSWKPTGDISAARFRRCSPLWQRFGNSAPPNVVSV